MGERLWVIAMVRQMPIWDERSYSHGDAENPLPSACGSKVAQTVLGGGEVSDAWTRIATPVRYCRLAKTLVKDDGAGMAAPLRVIWSR